MAKETQRQQTSERGHSDPSSAQPGQNYGSRGSGQYTAYSTTGQRSSGVRPFSAHPLARSNAFYDPWSYPAAAPFAMMRRLSEEMDRWFEGLGGSRGFLSDFGQGTGGQATFWAPHVDVQERDGKFLISADLPGVRREDLNVEIEPDAVTIHGERRHSTSTQERGVYRSERLYGSFYRQIPLPEGANVDNAQATFRDGVLEIEIEAPRGRASARRLEVKDAGSTTGSTTLGSGSTQYGSSSGSGGGAQQASGEGSHGAESQKR
jgi:HSP20 family protein